MKLPICAQAQPYCVDVDEKTSYAWCTCGLSENQPFCDGSHRGTEYRSLKHSIVKSGPVYYCGCKQTKTPPFCDGSHNALENPHED